MINPKLIREHIVQEKKNRIDVQDQSKTIHRQELLQHGNEVFILHKGDSVPLALCAQLQVEIN